VALLLAIAIWFLIKGIQEAERKDDGMPSREELLRELEAVAAGMQGQGAGSQDDGTLSREELLNLLEELRSLTQEPPEGNPDP